MQARQEGGRDCAGSAPRTASRSRFGWGPFAGGGRLEPRSPGLESCLLEFLAVWARAYSQALEPQFPPAFLVGGCEQGGYCRGPQHVLWGGQGGWGGQVRVGEARFVLLVGFMSHGGADAMSGDWCHQACHRLPRLLAAGWEAQQEPHCGPPITRTSCSGPASGWPEGAKPSRWQHHLRLVPGVGYGEQRCLCQELRPLDPQTLERVA